MMGYLESALTVPIESDRHLVYLPCRVHGGAVEMAEDVRRLERALRDLNGRRLVFASTAALYDGASVATMPTEDDPLPAPRSWYLLVKRTQEDMIRLASTDAVILRLGAIVGPAPMVRWDLLPNAMVMRAVTEGVIPLTMPNALRPMLGIRDAANAIRWALTAPAGTYNIATTCVGVRYYAELVAERCGAQIVHPGEPPHVPSFVADTSKAIAAGWEPRDRITDCIDGLRRQAAVEVAA